MVPLVERQGRDRLGGDSVVEDARRHTQADLTFFEVESPAHLTLVACARSREDHAGFRRRIEPGAQAELIHIVEVRAGSRVDEPLPVEAGRRSDPAGDEAR